MRFRTVLTCFLTLFMVSGCQNNTAGIFLKPEDKVLAYSREAVSEFQKIIDGATQSVRAQKKVFRKYDLSEEEIDLLLSHVYSRPDGDIVKNILFVPASEKLVKTKKNRYFYQVTVETNIKKETDEEYSSYTTYELTLKTNALKTVRLEKFSVSPGSLLDVHPDVAKNALDDLVSKKLDFLFSNLFALSKKEAAENHLYAISDNEETINNLIQRFKNKWRDSKWIRSEVKLDDLEKDEATKNISASGTYVLVFENSNKEKQEEEYRIHVELSQNNPDNHDYHYVFTNIEIDE